MRIEYLNEWIRILYVIFHKAQKNENDSTYFHSQNSIHNILVFVFRALAPLSHELMYYPLILVYALPPVKFMCDKRKINEHIFRRNTNTASLPYQMPNSLFVSPVVCFVCNQYAHFGCYGDRFSVILVLNALNRVFKLTLNPLTHSVSLSTTELYVE